jgi:hypothetical protein
LRWDERIVPNDSQKSEMCSYPTFVKPYTAHRYFQVIYVDIDDQLMRYLCVELGFAPQQNVYMLGEPSACRGPNTLRGRRLINGSHYFERKLTVLFIEGVLKPAKKVLVQEIAPIWAIRVPTFKRREDDNRGSGSSLQMGMAGGVEHRGCDLISMIMIFVLNVIDARLNKELRGDNAEDALDTFIPVFVERYPMK